MGQGRVSSVILFEGALWLPLPPQLLLTFYWSELCHMTAIAARESTKWRRLEHIHLKSGSFCLYKITPPLQLSPSRTGRNSLPCYQKAHLRQHKLQGLRPSQNIWQSLDIQVKNLTHPPTQ